MPPKNLEENKVMFFVDGELIEGAKTLESISFYEDLETPNIGRNFSGGFGTKFETEIISKELLLVLLGECTYEQLMCNNWRKMHGMPMRRKLK